jgi:hypothetical protein
MTLQHYVAAGLTVASDIVFPGLIESGPVEAPDIEVISADLPDQLADGERRGPVLWVAPGRMLIDVPGVVRMLMLEGRAVHYMSAPGLTADDVAIFVNAIGLGSLLMQRGLVVIHASAVMVGGAAVLLCGPSGVGKSTLAAALNLRGYKLIADDICVSEFHSSGQLVTRPDGCRLKLWREAIGKLSLEMSEAGRLRSEIDKFYVKPGAISLADCPVAALYRLRDDRLIGAPVIDRANLAKAAQIVTVNAYRPRLAVLLDQRELYLDAAAAVMGAGGVFTLRRPLGFALLDDTIATLERHWHSLGLIPETS